MTRFFMREVAVADAGCRYGPSCEKSVCRGPQAATYANYPGEIRQSYSEMFLDMFRQMVMS